MNSLKRTHILIRQTEEKLSIFLNCFNSYSTGLPCSSNGKERACNAGDQGQEDPLEKGTAIQSRNFAQRITWTEKLGGL